MDFPITLDTCSNVPLYQQLTGALRQAILDGRLSPGHHLPSARELAELLDLSRSTVVKSYQQLLEQGYLESLPGSGTYVKRSIHLNLRSPTQTEPERNLEGKYLSQFSRNLMQIEWSHGWSGDQPQLYYGAPPPDALPRSQWRDLLIRQCRLLHNTRHHDYKQEEFGYRPLRQAIASFLRRTKAIKCSPEQVIVYSGSQNALNAIARVLVDKDDLVLVDNPGYGGARETFLCQKARLVSIDVDEQGLQVEQLEKISEPAKLLYVTLSHHDPTGAVLSLARRQKLVAWASRTDTLIIEDAWDSDYHYGSTALPAVQGLTDEDRVLYIYSFWKLLFPLVTIGVLVVPTALIPVFTRTKRLVEWQYPIIEHYAMAEFLNEGHLENHIRRTRTLYQARRQSLLFSLSQCFGDRVTIAKFSAGLHQMVRFDLQQEEELTLKAAHEAGLPLVSTRNYYFRNPRSNEFLIPFANLEKESIAKAVARFADALRNS